MNQFAKRQKFNLLCETCVNSFVAKRSLVRHRQTSNSCAPGVADTQFACTYCPDIFARDDTRKRHESEIHRGIKRSASRPSADTLDEAWDDEAPRDATHPESASRSVPPTPYFPRAYREEHTICAAGQAPGYVDTVDTFVPPTEREGEVDSTIGRDHAELVDTYAGRKLKDIDVYLHRTTLLWALNQTPLGSHPVSPELIVGATVHSVINVTSRMPLAPARQPTIHKIEVPNWTAERSSELLLRIKTLYAESAEGRVTGVATDAASSGSDTQSSTSLNDSGIDLSDSACSVGGGPHHIVLTPKSRPGSPMAQHP